jgi:hypothetical protein
LRTGSPDGGVRVAWNDTYIAPGDPSSVINARPQEVAKTRCLLVYQDGMATIPSIYRGPTARRWAPATWADIVTAATAGLLDESHWVDLKREIPSTRGSNAELARDLASFAVDGGLLVIGVDEDGLGRADQVVGTDLAGLPERIDAVARSRIDPPLVVRSHPPLENPARPETGCLLVEVPPSSRAPHMVDHTYYGRGDRGKIKLSDPQVREIVERRLLGQADLSALLDDLEMLDPIPNRSERVNGRLMLIVHPVAARDDALVQLSTAAAVTELNAAVQRAVAARGTGSEFSPDLTPGPWHRRSDGIACLRGVSETGNVREDSFLELTVREDGAIALICGRGTSQTRSPWHSFGVADEPAPFRVVFPELVLGLVHGTVAFAADLANEHSGYQGQWQIGLRLTGLAGTFAFEYVNVGDTDVVQPYNRDTFQRSTTAHTVELTDHAASVTERLVAPLLRGLAIDGQYLPYPKN